MDITQYWVISPYDSTKTEAFERAWEYDLENGTIAVGWMELGDISQIGSLPELVEKYEAANPMKTRSIRTKDCNNIWAFYHEISENDMIIARRGTKRIIGIGRVNQTAFHNKKKGIERVGGLDDRFYPNFIGVEWEQKDILFKNIVFQPYTMWKIDEERYANILKREVTVTEDATEVLLESILGDFIVTSLDSLLEGQYELYDDPRGYPSREYPLTTEDGTVIGRIDILAKETDTNSLVVIELKRGRESDTVVGQVLRYMGWVRDNLCEEGQGIKGLIICKEIDQRLDHALRMVEKKIKVKLYRFSFSLENPPPSR